MGKDRRENTYYLIDWSYPTSWWYAEDNDHGLLGTEVIDKAELDRRLKFLEEHAWLGKIIFFGNVEVFYDELVSYLSVDDANARIEKLTPLQYFSFIHTFRKSSIGINVWKELESLLI